MLSIPTEKAKQLHPWVKDQWSLVSEEYYERANAFTLERYSTPLSGMGKFVLEGAEWGTGGDASSTASSAQPSGAPPAPPAALSMGSFLRGAMEQTPQAIAAQLPPATPAPQQQQQQQFPSAASLAPPAAKPVLPAVVSAADQPPYLTVFHERDPTSGRYMPRPQVMVAGQMHSIPVEQLIDTLTMTAPHLQPLMYHLRRDGDGGRS